MSVLARLPVLGLLAAHPGTHADKLRAHPAAAGARTDGPPPSPATGAGRYPDDGALLGGQPDIHPGLAWVRDLNRRLDSGHYVPGGEHPWPERGGYSAGDLDVVDFSLPPAAMTVTETEVAS